MSSKGAREFLKLLSVGLGILVFGMGLGAFIARGQAPDWNAFRDVANTLRCLDPDQDLGQIWQTDALVTQFHLVNDHARYTFEVKDMRGTCGCTKVEPASFKLAPGEKCTVTVTTDMEAYRWRDVPAPFAESAFGVAKGTGGEEFLLRLILRGTVRASYELPALILPFGRVTQGDTPEDSVEIACLSDSQPSGFEVVSAPKWVSADARPVADKPRAFGLSAVVKPDAPQGYHRERIRFRALTPSGPFVTRSVTVSAMVLDEFQALPSNILLATMEAGKECTVPFTVLSSRGRPFVVTSAEPTDCQLEVRNIGTAAAARHNLVIAIKPRASGLLHAGVCVRLKAPGGEERTAEVKVDGWVTEGGGPHGDVGVGSSGL